MLMIKICWADFRKSNLKSGFSMAEALLTMLIIGIVSTAAVPMMTMMIQIKTGVDKNTMKCITNDSSTGWYTESTGATSTPTSGTVCYAAVTDSTYNRGKAVNTAKWYADHGTSAQKILAKKVLRAACDAGGSEACDYFVSACWKSGSSSSPYCDDTSSFLDITYYLHLNPDTTSNKGVDYINTEMQGQLPKMITSLVNETVYDCNNNQLPDNGTGYQNLGTNLACELSEPWLYIKGCNLGSTDACTTAYSNNYNKSCYQVKVAWPEAPTDNYKLTFKGAGSPVTVACNMHSTASAAITGCNGMTGNFAYNCDEISLEANSDACSNDCYVGYTLSYNRSCVQLISAWPAMESGTFNLTSAGALPTEPVATECSGVNTDCTNTVGSICPDGTIYAGAYNGNEMFTTPEDCNSGSTYSWNDGSANYQTRYAGFPTLPNSGTNGKLNQYIIKAWNTYGNGTYTEGIIADATYAAANACEALNNTTTHPPSGYLGYSDWFLPAYYELQTIASHESSFDDTAPFASTSYWSSTESGDSGGIRIYFPSASIEYNTKGMTYRVRCIRTNATLSPPSVVLHTRSSADCSGGPPADIGTLCTDSAHSGQVYAGMYMGSHYYTTTADETSTYTWNDGTTPVTTSANSASNGAANTTALMALTGNSDYPYYAAQACDTKSLGTATDWFLPSSGEIGLFLDNLAAIGGFSAADYWTSTEDSVTRAYMLRANIPYIHYDGSKTLQKRVRCIRKG